MGVYPYLGGAVVGVYPYLGGAVVEVYSYLGGAVVGVYPYLGGAVVWVYPYLEAAVEVYPHLRNIPTCWLVSGDQRIDGHAVTVVTLLLCTSQCSKTAVIHCYRFYWLQSSLSSALRCFIYFTLFCHQWLHAGGIFTPFRWCSTDTGGCRVTRITIPLGPHTLHHR